MTVATTMMPIMSGMMTLIGAAPVTGFEMPEVWCAVIAAMPV